ncbi:MAG TPA: inorganic phosphate transporter, partial [Nitrospiria bacterium]|nr:inorganic phosphate transporter [Nitrospiria bacterium]
GHHRPRRRLRSRLGLLLMTISLLIAVVLWLAYANGANDNFKGVATLFGSGASDYRVALRWATATTLAGSLASIVIGAELVSKFSGKGVVPDTVLADQGFICAVAFAAATTVFLATRLGFPVSTTHALVGGLLGAGFAASGFGGVNVSALGTAFVAPLLIAPLLAITLTTLAYPLLHRTRMALGFARETCVCVGEQVHVVAVEPRGRALAASVAATIPTITIASPQECFQRYAGRVAGVSLHSLLGRLHFLSAGAVCFARGLNDTPKVVALLIAAQGLHAPFATAVVAVAMALGGWLSARRVAETMSHKITTMNHGQGLTANLATAFLMIWASRWGLPVSTTHVSCGSLFGIGAVTGQALWRAIGSIALAWVTALPVAAALAAVAYLTAG